LPTKLHFSSSCSLVVEGGKAHEFVVGVLGVPAGVAGEAHDGVAVDADEALGLADAAALAEVGEDGVGDRIVEPAVEQGGAFAFGEAPLARLAVEQAAVVGAVAGAHGDVARAATAVLRAVGIEAAEQVKVFHDRVHEMGPVRHTGSTSPSQRRGRQLPCQLEEDTTQKVDDGQKAQIRDSYKTCRDSKDFKTRQWTLCLPIVMSVDETKWFEDWREKQADSGIILENPWGASELEGLLYQDKNKGLREAFSRKSIYRRSATCTE
jgi:hypothetical protein